MPRQLSKDQNGNLTWIEEAIDPDGDEIFLDSVKVISINGAPVSSQPSWYSYTSSQADQGDGTRKLTVNMSVVASSLTPGDSVVFELICRDSLSDDVRRLVTLNVGEITPDVEQFVVQHVDNSSNFVYQEYDPSWNKGTAYTVGPSDDYDLTGLSIFEEFEGTIYSVNGASGDLYRNTRGDGYNSITKIQDFDQYNTGDVKKGVHYGDQKIIMKAESNAGVRAIWRMDVDGSNLEQLYAESGTDAVARSTMHNLDEKNGWIIATGDTGEIRKWDYDGNGPRLGDVWASGYSQIHDIAIDTENQRIWWVPGSIGAGSWDLYRADYTSSGLSNVTLIRSDMDGSGNGDHIWFFEETNSLYMLRGDELYQCDELGENPVKRIASGDLPNPPGALVLIKTFAAD